MHPFSIGLARALLRAEQFGRKLRFRVILGAGYRLPLADWREPRPGGVRRRKLIQTDTSAARGMFVTK